MKKKALIIGGIVLLVLILSPKAVDVVSANTDSEYNKFKGYCDFLIDELEGTAYENVKNDKGGETKFGIDKKSHPNEDIKNLTRERATQIYFESYWEAANINVLPVKIQLQHFCGVVNNGISGHNKILQRACGVYADGLVGVFTLTAAQFVTPEKIRQYELQHYDDIINNDDTQEVFREGWVNRVNKVYKKQTEINIQTALV